MGQQADKPADARRAYAARLGEFGSPALERAFALTRREDFLPPPPWTLYRDGAALTTSDPAALYQDALVAIDLARGVNNGQPSLHAQWLAAVAPRPGERVLHIGCGGGYYTAILAELVGPGGHVTAYEIEPDIAAIAQAALAPRANVEVRAQSGAGGGLPEADVIYVNAAAAAPQRAWLAALAPGGRLVFPWSFGAGDAAMLLARDGRHVSARAIGGVQFIPLQQSAPGGDRPVSVTDVERIRALVLRDDCEPDARCVVDFGWAWFCE
ncbi:MAG: SAM-dependent methyltransferase [Hyphomicrobiales bacterium]|nr:SAM-dependent methyltransferase [Hyphomicrobiales bacterium]